MKINSSDKIIDWYCNSLVAIFLSIILVILLFTATSIYSGTLLKCSNYANGKGQEYSVYFPNQCWIVVEGKNYTKQEYAYKFEGIKVTE